MPVIIIKSQTSSPTLMIVNKLDNGWEIIFQRHHGLVAARLFSNLKLSFVPESVDHTALMAAITEHDDGQRDWQEGRFVNDQGEPMDYSEYDYDLKHARKTVIEASYKSSYITLLISRHVTELYSQAQNISDELKQYLVEQKKEQKALLSFHKLSKDEFDQHYQLLRWCDELSLALCKGEPSHELPPLKPNETQFKLTKNEAFQLHPWPFRDDRLSIPLETNRLSQKTFADNEDLFQHLKQTSRTIREVVLAP